MQFWFDLASSYSYVAALRVEGACARAGISLEYKPFLLGPLFEQQLGIRDSPFNVHLERGRYMWRDLERLCEKYDLPWRRPSVFPRSSVLAARIACCAGEAVGPLVRATFRANFAQDQEIANPAVMRALVDGIGGHAPAARGRRRRGAPARAASPQRRSGSPPASSPPAPRPRPRRRGRAPPPGTSARHGKCAALSSAARAPASSSPRGRSAPAPRSARPPSDVPGRARRRARRAPGSPRRSPGAAAPPPRGRSAPRRFPSRRGSPRPRP